VLWMVLVDEYYDSSYRELVFVDPDHDGHAEEKALHAADTTVAVPQGRLHFVSRFLSAKHLFLLAKTFLPLMTFNSAKTWFKLTEC